MVTTAPKPPTQPTDDRVTDDLGTPPLVLRLSPLIELTEWQFAEFCSLNDDLRIERTATGELEIRLPAFTISGYQSGQILAQIGDWTRQDRSGISFGPSAGFTLPNGAIRGPGTSWISRTRLQALTPEQRSGFYKICPDFVIELRSDSDRLAVLQAKMQEYIANGAQLGWLIDPQTRSVHAYRPDAETEILQNPETISADPILPGFTLDLTEIWEWDL